MIKHFIERMTQDTKPVWEFWRNKRTATIEEAVLLSLDICPRKAKELGHSILTQDEASLFAMRMEIVEDWLPTFEYVDTRGGNRVFGDREIGDFYRFVDWMVNERRWTGLPVHLHDIAMQYQASLPPEFDFANTGGQRVVNESKPKPVRPWIPRAQELGAAFCREYIGKANAGYCTKEQTARIVAKQLEEESYVAKGGGPIDYQTIVKDAFGDGWWPKHNPSTKRIEKS